jgi:Ca2+-binding EF-hand superfamily protein
LDQESKLNIFLKNIFETIDTDNDNKITKESALDVFNRLNERLGDKYNKDQMDKFAKALDIDENNLLGYDEFIKAFKLIAF